MTTGIAMDEQKCTQCGGEVQDGKCVECGAEAPAAEPTTEAPAEEAF
ncbi:MAG: hypothetical protein IT406_01765 [Candidatus Yanofskybacteria bacterium]|nr:hypothetical protein [Candidatus Yanofskybacteria bacterium]